MRKSFLILLTACLFAGCQRNETATEAVATPDQFVHVDGPNLIKPDGEKLLIVGTNLGNWLNPEGYMFGFQKCNSYGMINQMFCELVGPQTTAHFWQDFKDNYITRADIDFIAKTGANTIRLPFHYKLFTDEDYMGNTSPLTSREGFARIDSVVSWCKANDLYLILDMHDAPGGQTGDNIDDSYGYPWLFENEEAQQQYCSIWRMIADYYKNETTILGYELINEPLPHYLENKDELNLLVEPLYKRVTAVIREVDANHVILLGGPQWNSTFECFTDWSFDPQLMYTCHRYGGPATKEAIQSYIDFRDKSNRPMYMGELGHNTMEWQTDFSRVMRENNIGYTYWPYKKVNDSCVNGYPMPEGWQAVIDFSNADRSTYELARNARPDQSKSRAMMQQLLENVKFANCSPQNDYIISMELTPVK